MTKWIPTVFSGLMALGAALWPTLARAESLELLHQPDSAPGDSTAFPTGTATVTPEAPVHRATDVASPTAVSAEREAGSAAKPSPSFGMFFDVGVPDGASVGLAYAPWYWLTFNGGLTYNLIGFGLRAGAKLAPFDLWITPSLVLEGGHYFDGSPRGFSASYLGDDSERIPDRMSYTYGNAHIGVELGRPFTFYLRGGLSALTGSATPGEGIGGDSVSLNSDLHMNAVFPSAKLGFTVLFL